MANLATSTKPRPALYVGTYAKYNSGSIKGAWLYLDDYKDKQEFLYACHGLHCDEADPELMFQDYEYIPQSLYSESGLDDKIFKWLDLEHDQREYVQAYWDCVDPDAEIDAINDAYWGTFEGELQYMEEWLDSTGMLSQIPENLRHYFDTEAFLRDCKINGDVEFAEGANYTVHAFGRV
tara:strand:- start:106 stop:642 length:537 start_codon:yes stop_codon:yes gene_type:complete